MVKYLYPYEVCRIVKTDKSLLHLKVVDLLHFYPEKAKDFECCSCGKKLDVCICPSTEEEWESKRKDRDYNYLIKTEELLGKLESFNYEPNSDKPASYQFWEQIKGKHPLKTLRINYEYSLYNSIVQ